MPSRYEIGVLRRPAPESSAKGSTRGGSSAALPRVWCCLLVLVAISTPSCGRPSSEAHDGIAPPPHGEAIRSYPVTAPTPPHGEGIRRSPVSSSALRSVGYDEEQQILEIEFTNGAVYRYFDVPAEVYRGLMGAESHGRYFHQHVRGAGYRYQKMK